MRKITLANRCAVHPFNGLLINQQSPAISLREKGSQPPQGSGLRQKQSDQEGAPPPPPLPGTPGLWLPLSVPCFLLSSLYLHTVHTLATWTYVHVYMHTCTMYIRNLWSKYIFPHQSYMSVSHHSNLVKGAQAWDFSGIYVNQTCMGRRMWLLSYYGFCQKMPRYLKFWSFSVNSVNAYSHSESSICPMCYYVIVCDGTRFKNKLMGLMVYF